MAGADGKVVWITGAGSGIGEAAARLLAGAGATVVLTGRREEELKRVAAEIERAGGRALVMPGDIGKAERAQALASNIEKEAGRVDVLFNNAGLNIRERSAATLEPAGIDALINANLAAAAYCSMAVMPRMRMRGDGLLIHTASWLGRYPHRLGGPLYNATKHAIVAMSQSINMEEFRNGIRSCVICPGEVATPVLDNRPVPVEPAERAAMLRPEDIAEIVLMIVRLPARLCLNEILISPTWNRLFAPDGEAGLIPAQQQSSGSATVRAERGPEASGHDRRKKYMG